MLVECACGWRWERSSADNDMARDGLAALWPHLRDGRECPKCGHDLVLDVEDSRPVEENDERTYDETDDPAIWVASAPWRDDI